MEFVITIRNKIAEYAGDAIYVCGNADCKIVFDFDIAWDGMGVKTARFVKDDGTYQEQVFTGNECPVPVISNTFAIRVGVYAGDLHTTTPAYIPAKKSILCGSGMPSAPSDDVYAQIMAYLNQIEQNSVSEAEIKAAIAAYLEENPVEGVTPEEVADEVNKALEEAKASGEFKGDKGDKGDQGEKGEPGQPGEPGEPGKDADPYTLPTASADTLGGVKVGSGLQMDGDVLGVKPEGVYELIETITLEEDGIKSIVRDVSLDGLMVLAKFVKASKVTNVFMEISCVGKALTGSAFIRTDGETSVRFNAQKKGGYWDLYSQGYVAGWGSGAYYGQNSAANVLFVANNPIITSVRLYASDGMDVLTRGSVIEIWGVRADA